MPGARREAVLPEAPAAWDEAVVPVVPEAMVAARERELGREVVQHRGRWWVRVVRGFYQPVCLLARMRPEEATRPTLSCWGYRASLAPGAEGLANATMPLHVLPDLRGYSLGRMASSQQRKVRRRMAEFDIVVLRAPDLLLEQGYPLAQEVHARNPRVPLPDRRRFERWAASYFTPEARGLVLAGLHRGRLLAFSTNSAVDGVAYGDAAYAGDEGRRYALTACLFHAFATITSRSPAIHTLVDGLHARENQGLCDFKDQLGLRVTHVPVRTWLAPLTATALRHAMPHVHYRLTGRG